MSNFKDTKIAIETIFYDDWDTTPIHFVGTEFNGTDIDKWIHPVYEPRAITNTSMSATSNTSEGMVYVACWAANQFDALDLADDVISFFNTYIPDGITSTRGSILNQGFDASGKAFVVLDFEIKSYIASC